MMVHLVLLGLNYVHFSAPLQIVRYLRRRPSDLHLGVYERLLALIKAGGPLEEINVLNCGRKSHQLDARLDELLEALQKNGLHNITSYAGLSEKTVVPPCNDREELRPYRDLDASRLKLSGSGAWDPGDYLSDLFYLPYVEPRINQFNITPPFELLPNLNMVKKEEVLKLCKVWDQRGLLRLVPREYGPKHKWGFSRVFNNYKNSSCDRQIGDRRGMNFCEGKLPGPSRFLPNCSSLLQLAPKPKEEMLCVAIAMRQCSVSHLGC